MLFEQGQRVRVTAQSMPNFARVRHAMPGPDGVGGWTLFLVDDEGHMHEVSVPAGDEASVRPIADDGGADSARVLAGMWTRWMAAAATNAESRHRLDPAQTLRPPEYGRLWGDAASALA